jgi:hypothetical protein
VVSEAADGPRKVRIHDRQPATAVSATHGEAPNRGGDPRTDAWRHRSPARIILNRKREGVSGHATVPGSSGRRPASDG